MPEDDPGPDRIISRVRDDPDTFVGRNKRLSREYTRGDEESEPVKSVQKEIDGMARLFRALNDNDDVSVPASVLVDTYDQELEHLRQMEEDIVASLPEQQE